MKAIYEFNWDCGRMGDLNGCVVATKEEVVELIGKEIYFGEVFGKHSEVYGILEASDLKVLSEDQDFINKAQEIFGGHSTISGYNPFDYYEDGEDEDGV